MYSNSEILSAVVTKWAMPLASTLLSNNISKIPFLDNIQSKVKSTGWVGASWSVANEISPFAEPIVCAIVQPMLKTAFGNIPDEQIPTLAHGIVDKALEEGKLVVLDGNVTFNKEDLTALKRLLVLNLPVTTSVKPYKVKEDEK